MPQASAVTQILFHLSLAQTLTLQKGGSPQRHLDLLLQPRGPAMFNKKRLCTILSDRYVKAGLDIVEQTLSYTGLTFQIWLLKSNLATSIKIR